MFQNYLLLIHPTFGVLGMMAAGWVFVDALNASKDNEARIRTVSMLSAVLIWLAYIFAGWFYVVYYGGDKAIIKAGPWPWAHGLFMETKEHAFFLTLLLATFLPIAAAGRVAESKAVRKVVLWSSAGVALLALAMEGAGAVISMGAKAAMAMQLGA